MRTSDFLFSLRKNDNLLKYMTESGKRKGRILLTVKVERAGGGESCLINRRGESKKIIFVKVTLWFISKNISKGNAKRSTEY
jgi:hypothetical protein